jgi:hypothetical protein
VPPAVSGCRLSCLWYPKLPTLDVYAAVDVNGPSFYAPLPCSACEHCLHGAVGVTGVVEEPRHVALQDTM